MNAIVAATVARLISEGGGVNSGVHFLMDAADPAPCLQPAAQIHPILQLGTIGVSSSPKLLVFPHARSKRRTRKLIAYWPVVSTMRKRASFLIIRA